MEPFLQLVQPVLFFEQETILNKLSDLTCLKLALLSDAEVFEYIAKHFVGCDLATSYFG